MLCVHIGLDDHEHNETLRPIPGSFWILVLMIAVQFSCSRTIPVTLTLDLDWYRFSCHPLEFTMRYLFSLYDKVCCDALKKHKGINNKQGMPSGEERRKDKAGVAKRIKYDVRVRW